MSSGVPVEVSRWIKYLSQLGPTSSNTGLFDEQLINSLKKIGDVSPLTLSAPLDEEIQDTVISKILSDSPSLILISGTAGEGKTRTERTIWEGLLHSVKDVKVISQSEGGWQGSDFPSLKFELASGEIYNVLFVKDLSPKLSEADTPEFLKQDLTKPMEHTCLIVACNHGMLLDHLRRDNIKNAVDLELAANAEKTFFQKEQSSILNLSNGLSVNIFDLSTVPISKRYKEIVSEVCKRKEWKLCEECPFHENCKFFANRNCLWDKENSQLRSPALRQIELMELLECSEIHVPVRDLLIIASNNLLGTQQFGKKPRRKVLMTCELIQEKSEKNEAIDSFLFSNLLGQNLPESYRRESLVYRELSKFEIGDFAPRDYDNLLNNEQMSSLQKFISADAYKSLWLDPKIGDSRLLKLLLEKMKRQAFFFSIPDKGLPINFDRWRLTSFKQGKAYFSYLEKIGSATSGTATIPRNLVKGMNRAFTGQFREETNAIWVTTSGTSSRKLQGEIVVVQLPLTPSIGNSLGVKLFRKNLGGLSVGVFREENSPSKTREPIFSFNLSPFLFEYFINLSEGYTFNSFSSDALEWGMKIKGQLVRFFSSPNTSYEGELRLNLLPTDQSQAVELIIETDR